MCPLWLKIYTITGWLPDQKQVDTEAHGVPLREISADLKDNENMLMDQYAGRITLLRFPGNIDGHKLKNLRSSISLRVVARIALLSIIFVGYTPQSAASSSLTSQPAIQVASLSLPGTVRFAAVGDYGVANSNELAVANLVRSWNPDFIITLGDNNYPDGTASTIDSRIGQYFHDYIYPYTGTYTPGSTTNRFFPALGNHDWIASGALPYLNYFSLPNNERYYTFTQGPVEFFVMDSDSLEPR